MAVEPYEIFLECLDLKFPSRSVSLDVYDTKRK